MDQEHGNGMDQEVREVVGVGVGCEHALVGVMSLAWGDCLD